MSVMLSEKTPDGVWLLYMGRKEHFSYRTDSESAKQAADELRLQFEVGQPITIQGVEFRQTPQGLNINDHENVMGQIASTWYKAFDKLLDIEEFNKEGYERLMALDESTMTEEEFESIYN